MSKTVSKKISFMSMIERMDASSWITNVIYSTIVLPHFQHVSILLYMCNKNRYTQRFKIETRDQHRSRSFN